MKCIKTAVARCGWLTWGLLLLAVLTACSGQPDTVVVSASGIRVAAEFNETYQSLGGLHTFGEPITAAFPLETNGRLVQYFQRMRLDYWPDGGRVEIYPLGAWAFTGVNPEMLAPAASSGRSRTFAETDQTVYGAFLAFYEENNGQTLLGLPISPQFNEGSTWTQYFANGRLEWHPALPVAQRVQLGLLGQAHFDAEIAGLYDPRTFMPAPSAAISDVIVTAAVRTPILYAGETQTLHVAVLTPDSTYPVPEMQLEAVVIYGDREQAIPLPLTDGDGRSQVQLDLPGLQPGQEVVVRVDVLDSRSIVIESANLWFKTWW